MAKILIIDDDAQVRKFIRKIIENEGHEATEAQDGKVGIKLFKTESVDLVITDIVMPEKEGIETIMELKRNDPNVKIIAISGGGGQIGPGDYLRLAENLGAIFTIRKPFTRTEMMEAINKVL